jgi:hypothetical protein
MQKMEREYRGEIDRLQNVIDVSNQLVEERQVRARNGACGVKGCGVIG